MPNSFPKITAVDVENAIVREVYFTAADGVLGANMLLAPENKQPINAEHSLLTFCIREAAMHSSLGITDEHPPPRAKKLLLLTRGGVAVLGHWGDDCVA